MKQKLQFKTMVKGILALSLFFVGQLEITAKNVEFTNANPTTDVLAISNSESTVKDVINSTTSHWQSCTAEGGAIQIEGTTDTATTICVGEGTDDSIWVEC